MKLLSACLPLMLFGCAAPVEPNLIRSLPTDFADGRAELEKRALTKFPLGSSEDALVKELKNQGFVLMPPDTDEDGLWQAATFERHQIPCITIWSVRWRATEKRIRKLWAVYGQQCP